MPVFEIQGQDGKTYEVEAPDQGAALAGFSAANKKAYSGTLIPFSKDQQGNVSFDSDAGIVGLIKRALTAPGEALYGKFDAMSDEGIKRGAETAGTFSPLSAASRAGAQVVPGVATSYSQSVPKVPTAEALQTAARSGYKEAGQSGVDYSGKSVSALIDDIERSLADDASIAENNPKTFNLLKQLKDAPEGSVVQLKYLDAIRKQLGKVGGDPVEGRAATIAVKRLDEFLEATDPSSVVARAAPTKGDELVPQGFDFNPGDTAFSQEAARSAADTLVDARGNAAAGFRSGRITGAENVADLRASAANSGQNIGNSIRQRLVDVLVNDKKSRGFNPEELSAIEDIIKGTPSTNAARYLGNLLGGGGGMGQALTGLGGIALGGAAGGVPGAVAMGSLPVIGAASKTMANVLTKRQVDKLDELIRSRSPLYRKMQRDAPWESDIPEKRAALVRALTMGNMAEE